MSRALVVGGGISGLTTALTLFHHNVDVEVLEAADRLGGKILTSEVAGVQVDAGPDAFLVREPHMTDLCEQLNIGQDLVSPATGAARLWLQGALRPLPRKQYLGVPLDLDDLAESGLITHEGLERAALDLEAEANAPAGDESAGAMIRRRLGDEVMDKLVGPLLGGINAGDADRLSLQAGVPQLAAAVSHDASVMRSIPEHLRKAGRDPRSPIFLTHPRGVGWIIDTMATRLQRRVHLDQPVSGLERTEHGWRVLAPDGAHETEAVVLSTPAFASARLLREHAPETAAMLDEIPYASVVMVTFAFATDQLPELPGSGFLIPRGEGMLMTACSQASTKWAHLAGPTTFLRVSAGHAGDERAMEMDDDALVDRLLEELRWTAGIDAEPDEVRITRWPRSFPQYRPGHGERVSSIEARLAEEAPGVVITGAAYRGLGLPACVHQGRRAAKVVEDYLGIEAPEPTGPGISRDT
ncbi:MAG: protoporphyrinogen oxidase [Actinomycetota bacterium]